MKATAAGETKETTSIALKVSILVHPVTLVMENIMKNDGDPDPDLTYTSVGEIYDTLTGSPAREEGEAEGEYEIGIGTLAFDDSVKDNYRVTVQNGKFTIVGTGVVTFSALPDLDLGDLSYITGRSGSRIRVSATKNALPKGAILSLTTVTGDELGDLTTAAGEHGLMKSFALSVVKEDGSVSALNKNAILRLFIPLTEKEEQFEPSSVTALFRKASGEIVPLELKREEPGAAGVTYLVLEVREPGCVAVVKGTRVPLKTEKVPATTGAEPAPKKRAPGLWVAAGIISAGAIGVIAWVLIRSARNEEPTKTYVPPKKGAPQSGPRPASPAGQNGEKAPARKVVSFEDLEDDEDQK